MLLNRDRNFFPKKLRLFALFVPETGPFCRVNVTQFLRRKIDVETAQLEQQFIDEAHAYVDHTTWWPTRRLVAHEYIRGIKEHGVRYELDANAIARKLGRVVSTINDHIRALRRDGFLQHYRKHYIDWKKTEAAREALANRVENPESIFCAARAVHEPGPSFPRSAAMFRSRSSDLLESSYPTGTYPLTWKDSPDG